MDTPEPIRLHDYWRSSSAYRVRIALNLLGLPYETKPVDLTKGEQAEGGHLSLNPQGLVPVLEIDGQTLTQSLAIVEYLDETREAGFLPRSPSERARVRALAMAVAMEIQPVCNLRVAKVVTAQSNGAESMESWMRRFIAPGLEALERLLEQRPVTRYSHGDDVTLADICLVPQVYNAERWGVAMELFPIASGITARLRELDAVAAAHPDRAPRTAES